MTIFVFFSYFSPNITCHALPANPKKKTNCITHPSPFIRLSTHSTLSNITKQIYFVSCCILYMLKVLGLRNEKNFSFFSTNIIIPCYGWSKNLSFLSIQAYVVLLKDEKNGRWVTIFYVMKGAKKKLYFSLFFNPHQEHQDETKGRRRIYKIFTKKFLKKIH